MKRHPSRYRLFTVAFLSAAAMFTVAMSSLLFRWTPATMPAIYAVLLPLVFGLLVAAFPGTTQRDMGRWTLGVSAVLFAVAVYGLSVLSHTADLVGLKDTQGLRLLVFVVGTLALTGVAESLRRYLLAPITPTLARAGLADD